MNVRRYSGYLLMLTAVLHMLLGLLLFWQPLRAMLQAGLFNSIAAEASRGMAFWFLLFGMLLFLVGQSMQWSLAQCGRVPRSVSWGLLGIALVGCVVMPVSGFWLVIPQVWLLLRAEQG